MLKFLESTFNYDLPVEDHRTIFEMININQAVSLPNRNDIATLIRETTGFIKSGDEKKLKLGLSWLCEIVKWSSTEVLCHHSHTWMKLALEILEDPPSFCIEEVFRICRTLISRLPTSQTEKFSEEISLLIQHILQVSPHEKITASLECLEIILEKAPNICKSQGTAIEGFLVSFFGLCSGNSAEVLATCMSRLPLMYGEQSSIVWSRQYDKIFSTLMKVMDVFYRVISLEMTAEITEYYNLPDVRGHHYPFIFYLRYFNTLCACAIKMLSGHYLHTIIPARKTIKFIDIVFSFSEKVNKCDLASPKFPWLTILPNMLKSTSELLESLILNCWEVLQGFSSSILSLVVTKLNSFIFPNSKCRILRVYFYRIIAALISKLQDASLGNHYSTITNLLLEDIQIMSIENRTTFESSYDVATSSNHSSVPETYNVEFKRKCCHEALRVLSVLVTMRKIRNVEGFIEEILKIFNLLSLPSSHIPYDDCTARFQLYRILLSGITELSPGESKHYAICIQVFQRGICDADVQVSDFCRMALHLSSSLSSLKQIPRKEPHHYDLDSSIEEMLPKHLLKDCFNEFDPEIIPKDVIDSLVSESEEVVMNHNSMSANQDLEQEGDDGQLNNHNEDEDLDEEILENDESIEDEQMIESEEEEGEVDDEDEEEEEEEELEEEEEYDEESKVFEAKLQEDDHESQTKEKPSIDNGYFTMQNGTASSDEGTPTLNEKRMHVEESKEIEEEEETPPAKKLKHMDERSQDGSVSDNDTVNMNSMMDDFIDKPPDEDVKS